MLRNQEVMSLQEAASLHRAGSDLEDMEQIGVLGAKKPGAGEDDYLLDDDLAEDAVLSGATVAAFALDDDYGADDDPIADELSLMGFRADTDFA